MKKLKLFAILVIATVVATSFALTGCTKDDNLKNKEMSDNKTLSNYAIPLDKEEIDVLANEIGIAHNSVLFALYNRPDIDTMNATTLCNYVHNYLDSNINEMGLSLLPKYLMASDSIEEMKDVYSNIGQSIENGCLEWHLPDDVDQELIISSMDDYYIFVRETFLNSNTYDDFEATCMNRLSQLCDSTTTINDYFYMSVYGNVSFASFCAWVTIFSGINNDSKSIVNNLRNAFNFIKERVTNLINSVDNWVAADVWGAAWGGITGLVIGAGIAIGTDLIYAPLVGISVGMTAGAITGSIHYANNN